MRRIFRIAIGVSVFVSLSFVLWNCWRIFSIALDHMEDGRKNIVEGLPFFFGERQNKGIIIPAMKLIPEASRLYYWTIPELENEISHECRAYELAYYLFPLRVGYRGDGGLAECDFVLCEDAFGGQLSRRLIELELLGTCKPFRRMDGGDGHVAIFAREGRSLIPEDSAESGKIMEARLAASRTSPREVMLGVFALVFLVLLGWIFLQSPFFCEIRGLMPGANILPLAFVVGAGGMGLSLYYLSFLGLAVNRTNGMLVAGALFILVSAIFCFRRGRSFSTKEDEASGESSANVLGMGSGRYWMFTFAAVPLLAAAMAVLALAFSSGASDAAGQAVWGMKTRVAIFSGPMDLSFLEDSSRMYSHPDYPPLWPLLLSWISLASCGTYNELTVKLFPLASLFILWGSVFLIGRHFGIGTVPSLAVTAIFAGNFHMLSASAAYYAEAFLALLVLWGFFMLAKYLASGRMLFLCCGLAFLGIAGLVKNEGVAVYALASLACLTCSARALVSVDVPGLVRSGALKAIICILLFPVFTFLPWIVFIKFYGIPVYDYDFSLSRIASPLFASQAWMAAKEIFRLFFLDVGGNCGFWYLVLAAFVLYRRDIFRNKGSLFLFLVFAGYLILLPIVFGFSVRRMDWHLRALPRVLELVQIPAVVIVSFVARKTNVDEFRI